MYYQEHRPPRQPAPQPPNQRGTTTVRRRKRHPWLRALLLLLAFVVVIGGITGILYFRNLSAQVTAVQGVYLQNIYVDGIHLGGMTPQQAIDAVVAQVNARQNSWNLRLTYQGHVFTTLQYATLGITTDLSDVYDLLRGIYQMGKEGTLLEKKQAMDELAEIPYLAYTTQSTMTHEQLDSILSQIAAQLVYAPTDAYLAYFYPDLTDPFIIQGENYGSTLDVAALKTQILEKAAAGESGDLEIRPQSVAPNVTTADVRGQISLLCKAVTQVSDRSTADRTSNIRAAFSYLNGQKLEPGATLSFNQAVGARTLERGFKYAIEYVSGQEEVGVGGGVCQASTTLYLAALQSNLEITKREPHSDPVSYTTFGQDATVYYSRDRKIDLAFKNTSGGTVYITAHVEQTKANKYQCVVCIYGPSLGDQVSYKLRTTTVETISAPLDAVYRQDTSHKYVTYKDEEPYLLSKARDGYINETYLQRWESGRMVSETLVSRDTCKARAATYMVGTQNR